MVFSGLVLSVIVRSGQAESSDLYSLLEHTVRVDATVLSRRLGSRLCHSRRSDVQRSEVIVMVGYRSEIPTLPRTDWRRMTPYQFLVS